MARTQPLEDALPRTTRSDPAERSQRDYPSGEKAGERLVLSAKWIRGVIGLAALVWALIAFLSGETLKWSWAKSLGLTAAIVVWAVLAYDRWIWKWPGIRRFAGKPVIHGTWKTELRTSYEARQDETIEAYLVIRQTYSR